jgi:nicotinamidase-related amidase
MTDTPRSIGSGRNAWQKSAERIALAPPRAGRRPVALAARPLALELDLARTAMIVVDMQNAYCAPGGLTDLNGGDLSVARAPIAPLNAVLPTLRRCNVPIVWLNWGHRPDRLNVPPMTLHAFDPAERGRGVGDELPGGRGNVLLKDSWSAAIVDELVPGPDDIHVDKYRVSGFWDTPLDSILRNLDIRTLLLAGVNLDVCVYHTLADAHFLGYDCILVEDCSTTTAPQFCTDATLHNIKKCFGFLTTSTELGSSLHAGPEIDNHRT